MTRDEIIAMIIGGAMLGITGAFAIDFRRRYRRAKARIDQLSGHVSAAEHLLHLTDPARTQEVAALEAQLALPAHERQEDAR
ncbi:hypothetical protein [Actinoplanes aureus]|uniref:Uncharacterized protein n=1 Tax=Actinoplanes aureus TaxID=2792083 RepID=A0A931FVE3_9ACTN|nr:hypothetical protein [Actinoplanes aureus]MBG0560697.1 hypothetical protein [Actinoplanes aureus]